MTSAAPTASSVSRPASPSGAGRPSAAIASPAMPDAAMVKSIHNPVSLPAAPGFRSAPGPEVGMARVGSTCELSLFSGAVNPQWKSVRASFIPPLRITCILSKPCYIGCGIAAM